VGDGENFRTPTLTLPDKTTTTTIKFHKEAATMTTPVNATYLQDKDVHPIAATTTNTTTTNHNNNINNNGNIELVAEPRAMDELEGALLMPVATQVHVVVDKTQPTSTINNNKNSNNKNNNSDNDAMAAVPVQIFDYDEAVAKEEQDDVQQQLRQPLLQQQQHVGIAYAIPYVDAAGHHPHPNSIADDSHVAVKYAQYTGTIRAEQEREAIRYANRQVYAQNYWEAQSVEAANDVAKRRDREGLQMVMPDVALLSSSYYQNSTKTMGSTDQPPSHESSHDNTTTTTTSNSKGYQIQEYDIPDDYDTRQYEVQEYKSIYD
jgi:hypothetical protein